MNLKLIGVAAISTLIFFQACKERSIESAALASDDQVSKSTDSSGIPSFAVDAANAKVVSLSTGKNQVFDSQERIVTVAFTSTSQSNGFGIRWDKSHKLDKNCKSVRIGNILYSNASNSKKWTRVIMAEFEQGQDLGCVLAYYSDQADGGILRHIVLNPK